jgi:hypothetical protein
VVEHAVGGRARSVIRQQKIDCNGST